MSLRLQDVVIASNCQICYFQLASGKLCPAQLEIPHVDK